MTEAVDRNRLASTHSPYLRQHADNPVNWQPWDEQALSAARDRDVPIFLSVGYAACHWCHVMESESFQNEEIAAVLNEKFVPIKVDREERPDLDRIYQTVCQLVTASGGWPLSAWLTPDGRPFFIGTYFPPESMRGRPGFGELLERISESWETEREAIEERADQWLQAAKNELEVTDPTRPTERAEEGPLMAAANAAVRSADRVHGGFGEGGPKFPQPRRIEILLRAAERTGRGVYGEVIEETLDAMANRGLFDHIGGGFHRYATDRAWRIPHFEKMLYDNAELSSVYLAAYQLTGTERYASIAAKTLDFVRRELTHADGGFFSTLDAQSDGREGTFYVWTPSTVANAVEDEWVARLFCDRYGITEEGNFEGGTSVLAVSASIEDLADAHDISPEVAEDTLRDAMDAVVEEREHRERPRRDEKILAGWNGLMISAFAEAGLILEERHLATARDALDFVRAHHWDADSRRLHRRYLDGEVGIDGYLDDYAYLALAALDVYQVSGDVEALRFALDLARAFVAECWDPDDETFYYTPQSGESLVSRPQDLPDQSLPSSLGVALEVLTLLEPFDPQAGFVEMVDGALDTHYPRIAGAALQHATLVLVADLVDSGGLEVTLAADTLPAEWRSFLGGTYFPGRLLAPRPPDDDSLEEWLGILGVDEVPPIWAERGQREGETTAYICREFTCSPPLTEVDEATEWVRRLQPGAGA